MNKFLYACLAFAGLTAYTDETEDVIEKSRKPLEVMTSIGTEEEPTATKGLIWGTNFTIGQTIRISLLDQKTGVNYENKTQGYTNVPYVSAKEGAGLITWSAETLIYLSPTEGKAIAYYPYSQGTDAKAIPVELTAAQTDYMYFDWVEHLSSANATAKFSMNHALASVEVVVKKSNYGGTAQLTQVSVSLPAFGNKATLNAETGELSAIEGTETAVTVNPATTITTDGVKVPVILVPNAQVADPQLTLKLTIYGKNYTVSPAISESVQQGYIYRYTLTLYDARLTIQEVEVVPWNENEMGEGNLSEVIQGVFCAYHYSRRTVWSLYQSDELYLYVQQVCVAYRRVTAHDD